MTILLRDALHTDLETITEIYRDSVENGVASYELTPPILAEMTRRFRMLTGVGYPYIVAEAEDGVLLGYAYAGAYRTRPAYRWTVEDSIYLPPQSRGRGVGKALLGELIERCTVLGFRQMLAVIGGAHPASVNLHRAMGFALTGTIKATGFKHGSWLDTVIMQLELGEGSAADPDMDTYPGTLIGGR
jgi:phosphinothricin acetyltransferase